MQNNSTSVPVGSSDNNPTSQGDPAVIIPGVPTDTTDSPPAVSAPPPVSEPSVLVPPSVAPVSPNQTAAGGTPPGDPPITDFTAVQQPADPPKSGKKKAGIILGILFLIGGVAAAVFLVQRQVKFRQKANETTGIISIFKFICTEIGKQDVCNGRDTSLGDYKVDFRVHLGDNDGGPIVDTVTVKISDNANGNGNTGNASQGRSSSRELTKGKYTVCEVPVAYNDAGNQVPLQVEPRPEASHGGSSGGVNQTQFSNLCITVDLNPGNAELKYLDKRLAPAPTSTPTVTPPPKSTATPVPTNTPTPTTVPEISAQCFDVVAYDSAWHVMSAGDLSKLKAGDVVKFAVTGTTSSGSFLKAKFYVNGNAIGESNVKKPASNEFYIDYTVPGGTNSFSVKGELEHSSLGWI